MNRRRVRWLSAVGAFIIVAVAVQGVLLWHSRWTPTLVERLGHPQEAVRHDARQRLAARGMAVDAAVRPVLESENEDARRNARWVLARIHRDRLWAQLTGPDSDRRLAAMDELHELGGAATEDALRERLGPDLLPAVEDVIRRSTTAHQRLTAIALLDDLGGRRVFRALLWAARTSTTIFDHGKDEVQKALERHGDRTLIGPLRDLASEVRRVDLAAIAAGLEKRLGSAMPPEDWSPWRVEAAIARTRADDPHERRVAVEILTTAGPWPESAARARIEALEDPVAEVRRAAVRSFSYQLHVDAVPVLATIAADDPEPDLRALAVTVLGRYSAEEAHATVDAMLTDEDPHLRAVAALALADQARPDAPAILEALLETEQDPEAADAMRRALAAARDALQE